METINESRMQRQEENEARGQEKYVNEKRVEGEWRRMKLEYVRRSWYSGEAGQATRWDRYQRWSETQTHVHDHPIVCIYE